MTESLATLKDGFAFFLAFLIELIYLLHCPPVGNVSILALAKEAVQHPTAREKANMTFVQRRHGSAVHLLLLANQHATGILHGHGALDCILNFIQRQACVVDRASIRKRDEVTFCPIGFECRN